MHSAGYLSCMSRGGRAFRPSGENSHSSWIAMCTLRCGSGISNTPRARVEKFGHNNAESLRKALSFEKAETPKLLIFEGHLFEWRVILRRFRSF